MTTIAFIEDNAGYRHLLETIIGMSRRYRLVGAFESLRGAMAGLAPRGADIVVVDVRLADHSGIEAVTRLLARWPHTRCVMLTNSEESADLFAALEAGAAGYLLKNDSPNAILAGLDELVAGGAPMSRSIARRVVGSFARGAAVDATTPVVTPREGEIMDELTRGSTYKEIGRSLGISGATVKNHLSSIYEKLRVRSRTEAVVKWLKR
jgi:DNA-binding NarL/FixJ family response regulator